MKLFLNNFSKLCILCILIVMIIVSINIKSTYVSASQCPQIPPDTVGICVEECSNDSDCDGDQMCCSNGCGHTCMSPTLVNLAYFTVTPHDNYVLIEWETDMELINAGFNIWRSEGVAGEYIKINNSLILAQGSGSQYSFTDDAAVKGKAYYYKLEDIDLNGASTFHSPVLAKRFNNGLLPATQFLLRH